MSAVLQQGGDAVETTIQFLDAVRVRHGLTSDYQLAKLLGVNKAAVSLLRQRKTRLGELTAMRVAALLDLSPGYVLACVAAERTKSADVRRAWRELAGRAAAIAAVAVLVGLAPSPLVPVAQAHDLTMCIMLNLAIAIAIAIFIVRRVVRPFAWRPCLLSSSSF